MGVCASVRTHKAHTIDLIHPGVKIKLFWQQETIEGFRFWGSFECSFVRIITLTPEFDILITDYVK